MKFSAINLIWLFLLLPLLAALYRWAFYRKRQLEKEFADDALWKRLLIGVSSSKQRVRPVMVLGAVAFLLLALLQPRWGYHWEDVKRRGIDLIVAVDTSRSMLADDVKPNRLDRAKREVEDLVQLLRGDRVGLIAFSGSAFVLCPLTLDYGAFRMFVDDLSATTVPRGGTDLAAAIEKAISAFTAGPGKYKALLLISDGENLEGNYEAAARKAREEGIKIFTIGIGKVEGVPIKITTPRGTSYLKDREGNIVVSKLDESALQQIALITGGAYHRATASGLELDLIYRERIAKMEKKELESSRKKIYEHRFQWPLAVALLFVFLEAVIGERKGVGWQKRILGKRGKTPYGRSTPAGQAGSTRDTGE